MWKKILFAVLILLVVGGYFGYQKYLDVFGTNVPENLADPFIEIPTGSSYNDIKDLLHQKGMLLDTATFTWVAQKMNFVRPKMRSGRFKVQAGWSNRELIQHLRGGVQATVKVVLTNERLPEQIAGKVSSIIEADSASIDRLLRDASFLEEHGYTPETAISLFIPNTYDFYWNKNAEDFFQKMLDENKKFWGGKNRLEKAAKKEMTPQEVYNLASIVERETNQKDEKPRIAGVYLNRLKVGMLLQADPTVVFATRDFTTRRVTNKHLAYDSPYNTYLYTGLPPGPISMAEINTIDAVLDAEDHDYIFFCARGDGTGYHNFAKTLRGHNVNAARYRKNLKNRGKR